ncbi:MAG: glycosyltransferase [Bacteroidia bacterium]|nr:glycosyltransferase [Bacteroidia bacterium]
MKFSVVIVNYNVRHFLEQCLYSVMKSIRGIEGEIIVVDNNSVDGSCKMVQDKFPGVTLIENKKNTGFSFANNQAIRVSKGEYVLLLNPDTVVEEDTFTKIIQFMDERLDAGGLGVKMIDGKARFLPESKRGLPTPLVAFYKIFGFSKLFPGSKTFGKYHLGYLNKDEIHEVDVLSGAFMLLRKSVLDTIGLLDESFFMYGEDIDISYRITKAGYKNYYFPKTTIIHYKGESTKKGSVNYVLLFYNAMIIFANKHFSKQNAKLFSFLINSAVYFRASLALTTRFIKTILLPLLDALLIFAGYYFIKPYWESYKFSGEGTYPPEYLKFVVPSYILIWLISIFFAGGYDKPVKIYKIIKGILAGTFIILVIYSLLSEEFRFSRALILIGTAWVFIFILLLRLILHVIKFRGYQLGISKKKRVLIVGFEDEANRIGTFLKHTEENPMIVGYVCPESSSNRLNFIGSIDQINEIIRINTIDEIIFCAKDISARHIIGNMLDLTGWVDYKIASPDSFSVIGSNSINTAGDLYTINLNSVTKVSNRRNKRLLDVLLSLVFLFFSPVLIFIVHNKAGLYRNIFSVLAGFVTWVGYCRGDGINTYELPKIKNGILNPLDVIKSKEISVDASEKINMNYAKDYRLLNDMNIILKSIKNIGR